MELYEYTVHELVEKLEKGEVTSEEITRSYLDRIKEKDIYVKAYITVLEDEAIKKAREVDEARKSGKSVSKYAGIPIGIKDNMCIEGTKTTCSSKMLENFIAPYNATVIEKLNSHDMVYLGKLNMDEFAMGSSTEHSAFFKTHNPWDLDRVPGGSSGGSAAAVAAEIAPWTLGSDTGGSIRQPASLCGVVGLKPTYGLVSRYGLVAFASSLDQIGPLTKDVTDSAILLNLIAGHDEKDSTSLNLETKDYTKALINDVKGMKIGLPKEYIGEGVNEEVKKSILDVAKKYEEMGAIVEECSFDVGKYATSVYYIIADAEASSNLGRFDGIRYGYRSEKFDNLKDIYKNSRSEGFGEEVKRRIMVGTYVLSSGYYDAYYKKAQRVRTVIKNAYNELFNKYDLLLTPTSPTTAFKMGEKSDNPLEMYLADICTVPVNIGGLPGMSIPCGLDSKGLPISFQLISKAFNEEAIFRAAYTYEQNTNFRENKPSFKGGND
ncbi:MAG: Asp-tRNA(Asn)/Glu-tRNA(Gln) amidotransferase subunit GatA [Clostridia bacterium]|jgi:aspartyl-tRNA(Asn)/glutamyl-tRNA(Gln) amidotransferase subunit A|nr:Asp-tRNA(Asn)/Glu-tRNA(Gln) amidotransferase subunit GatA [Clostridia bacterium]